MTYRSSSPIEAFRPAPPSAPSWFTVNPPVHGASSPRLTPMLPFRRLAGQPARASSTPGLFQARRVAWWPACSSTAAISTPEGQHMKATTAGSGARRTRSTTRTSTGRASPCPRRSRVDRRFALAAWKTSEDSPRCLSPIPGGPEARGRPAQDAPWRRVDGRERGSTAPRCPARRGVNYYCRPIAYFHQSPVVHCRNLWRPAPRLLPLKAKEVSVATSDTDATGLPGGPRTASLRLTPGSQQGTPSPQSAFPWC